MSARRSVSMALVWVCGAAGGLLLWSAPALAQRMHEFSKSFGSEGSGAGQLLRPGALAVDDATGDVYVVDRGNGRVEVFDSTGAYVSQFDGSTSPTEAFSWQSLGVVGPPEGAIAIDNSVNALDPSKGDVYVLDDGHNVIDKFTSSGAYVGQVTGTSPGSPFPSDTPEDKVHGIAVDPNGTLWVEVEGSIEQFNNAQANEYVAKMRPLIPPTEESGGLNLSSGIGSIGFAFDSEDNFYIGRRPNFIGPLTFPAEFTKAGEILVPGLDGEETTGLGVDLSSDDVYVDHGTSIAAYGPAHSPIERFGSAQMHASTGIAVDSATGAVYASDVTDQAIDVFTAFVVPDTTTGSVSNFAETSVTVSGVVNPDGLPVTSCLFEYGTSESYGQSRECSTSPGSGSGPVAVSVELTGLERLTQYHFRLKTSNANGSNVGQDRTFVTPEPVGISEESVSDISSGSALFSAQVDPGGADTTYHFEYGTTESYGESVPAPAGNLGAGTSGAPAVVRAQDLLAETTYHVRMVASNVLGAVYGPDETFTTQPGGGAFILPDGREWEMVSPPIKDGASIEPMGQGLIEASENGSKISYLANGPTVANPAGNPGPFGPTQILSLRGAAGWSSQDIATPHDAVVGTNGPSEYRAFSSDLSQALVEPVGATPLSPETTEYTPYLRDNGTGDYLPLVTASNVPLGTRFSGENREQDVKFLAGTPDLSHVLVSSADALTPDAKTLAGSLKNIYELSGGRLQLVDVLPDGSAAPFGGTLGGVGGNIRHALSSDGSRVFWEGGGGVFMRDTVTDQTVKVDAPAPGVAPPPAEKSQFQTASDDGSKVFFSSGEPLTDDSTVPATPSGEGARGSDLYVYDTATGTLTDLSVNHNVGEQANVPNFVLGTSEDGSIVYFVATGVLASGAEAGEDNLYVVSETGSTWSQPRLVATLSKEDGPDWAAGLSGIMSMTSRVSPNGRYLAFMSERSLTGYDNRDANSGQLDEEVFVYDEATRGLRCVSCDPTGARPEGIFESNENRLLVDQVGTWAGRWLAASIPGYATIQTEGGGGMTYQSRYLSDEGRLFFNSADALVAQDTNGREDVYEYEPPGVGGCGRPGGCVSLISSGTSAEESAFMDASETGNDAFFLTAARLTAQDVDTTLDLYDAHVCSTAAPCVSPPVSAPPCSSGDSCKAAPSPQPAIFGAPASATFSGAGNVAQSTTGQGTQTRSLTGAQKLAAALKGCRGKPRKKRASCESRARKRYGAAKARQSLSGKGRR